MLAALFALAACSNNENESQATSSGETVTIAHVLDTVQVPVNPERVVALDFGAVENLELVDANIAGIPKTGLPS